MGFEESSMATNRKAIAYMMLLGAAFSVLSLPGCSQRVPQASCIWILQQGPVEITLSQVSLTDLGAGLIEATWEFSPPSLQLQESLGLRDSTGYLSFTLLVVSDQTPNWRGFEVRDGGALVNHLVQPEEDYLATGGDPRMVAAARNLPVTGRSLHFITFSYPSDLGIKREPGPLTIRHRLAPSASSRGSQRYTMGWVVPKGPPSEPRISVNQDVAFRRLSWNVSMTQGAITVQSTWSPWVYVAAVALAAACFALVLRVGVNRRRGG